MTNSLFWKGKKVLITGNTGFKGSWLTILLKYLGADIYGYSLRPPTDPSLFELAKLNNFVKQEINDIRNYDTLSAFINKINPNIIFHLAAQPLVRDSYINPIETYQVNVIGTVNILEATRKNKNVKVLINITTDKCYENKEWVWGYRENDTLGGYDPYSNSKACAELVTSAFRDSFFNKKDYGVAHNTAIASARAGNVIGGGDFAKDRLIPDFIRSLIEKKEVVIRNPDAIRPWQHVLEPLSGYLLLAEKCYNNAIEYSEAWNFGPDDSDAKTVEWIIQKLCSKWKGSSYVIDKNNHPHEAKYLKLDCSKAKYYLNWKPKWNLEIALDKIIEWTMAYINGNNILEICNKQIEEYINTEYKGIFS